MSCSNEGGNLSCTVQIYKDLKVQICRPLFKWMEKYLWLFTAAWPSQQSSASYTRASWCNIYDVKLTRQPTSESLEAHPLTLLASFRTLVKTSEKCGKTNDYPSSGEYQVLHSHFWRVGWRCTCWTAGYGCNVEVVMSTHPLGKTRY